jgi:hypothetical protein
MPDEKPDVAALREMALSRWDNEGGASVHGPQEALASDESETRVPALTESEIRQLRVRVIALENLVIALLGGGSEQQVSLAREMAAFISPRPGFTHHPMTLRAAVHMNDLVDRADHFREEADS